MILFWISPSQKPFTTEAQRTQRKNELVLDYMQALELSAIRARVGMTGGQRCRAGFGTKKRCSG
jgi:hypothetical protein